MDGELGRATGEPEGVGNGAFHFHALRGCMKEMGDCVFVIAIGIVDRKWGPSLALPRLGAYHGSLQQSRGTYAGGISHQRR